MSITKQNLCALLCALFILALNNAPAFAQNTQKSEPLVITAIQTLEWHQNDQKYIARGDVHAAQGDTEIRADLLVADYKETAGKNFDIYLLTANGSVNIMSKQTQAIGDKAVYNVQDGIAIMTGSNLKLISADQTVTATDKFEYYVDAGKLIATGSAKVTRGEDTLEAQKMTADFTEDANGKRTLSSATAIGGVIITTPEETLTGQTGFYNADTQIATITGNVVITRGKNTLKGSKAEIDLSTNISKMYAASGATNGSGQNTGRVRGVFYPGKGNDLGNIIQAE